MSAVKDEDSNPDDVVEAENKDDCSDLTDNNNNESEEQSPKSFPQKVSGVGSWSQ